MADIPVIRGSFPYEQERDITGMMRISETQDDEGNLVEMQATWSGNEKLLVSKPFLDDLDPRWAKRNGDMLTICQYTLKLLAYYPDEQLYIAQRIAPPLNEVVG